MGGSSRGLSGPLGVAGGDGLLLSIIRVRGGGREGEGGGCRACCGGRGAWSGEGEDGGGSRGREGEGEGGGASVEVEDREVVEVARPKGPEDILQALPASPAPSA